jgi:GNAT superfamily N-acetyltransferase
MEYINKYEKLKLIEAKESDCQAILDLIYGIARYEKMTDQVTATVESLYDSLFVKQRAKVILAYENDALIGYMLYFFNYSTFTGGANIYLEDLFIYEEYRHKGYGKEMLRILAQIALENNAKRIDWVCLDWNEPSLEFYKKIAAEKLDCWVLHRLNEENIKKLAE